MELRILDNILHGVLKPWKLDTTNNKRFIELVKNSKKFNPLSCKDLQKQLSALLIDYPTLLKVLATEQSTDKPIQPLCFNSDIPNYKDAVTNFYYLVITLETQRLYNAALEINNTYNDYTDIIYNINKILTYCRVLSKQISIEMKELGYTEIPTKESDLTHYTLYSLKHSLIQLYFSIQEQYKNTLEQTTTLEDFYLLDLEESLEDMVFLEKVALDEINKSDKINRNTKQKLSFGFTGDIAKLKIVLTQLNSSVELLNVEVTTVDQLINLLTAKNIEPNMTKIRLGCETVQFRYIIDKLKPFFSSLNAKKIELSKSFYSKKGTIYNAQNLYTNKISNPKSKDKIDNIIKHLQ
jgi:hypothetical protein